MKKIYLSPSSQPANTYAGLSTNEQEVCRERVTSGRRICICLSTPTPLTERSAAPG